jgi:ABC-type antimicrobial peptide transport system permease subunit
MRQAATFVLAGLAAGLTAAALVARSLSGMLFSVSTADPGVYAAAAACALLIATAATAIPAIRATRVDPMTALRCD